MKKKITLIAILIALVFTFFLTGNSYAATLDNVTSSVDKQIVRPGEEVKVTINFGTAIGSATVNVAYDNKLFSYVGTSAGTGTDQGSSVQITFDDETNGTNSITEIIVTFKALEGITTSNPTEFTITAENLKNADKSEEYDSITTPIVENITLEPDYKDYTIDLSYTGDIIENEAKEMILTYSSSMGRYYEHVRLVAEVTAPEGATVKLTGTNETEGTEQDLILNGWGDPQGYAIGGENVNQTLNLTGVFSDAGTYSVTFKLIDRDNSDSAIAEKTVEFTVKEKEEETTPTQEETKTEVHSSENEEIKPETLPKTGENIYLSMALIATILAGATVAYNKKHK